MRAGARGDRAPRGTRRSATRSTRRPARRRTRRGWPSRCCAGPRSSGATGWTRCRRTWPGGCTALRDYEFMDPGARDAFNALTDELRQQLLETYFQGLKEGVAGISPEDLDGVREMVRDLNSLLEKHASGADTPRRIRRASWRSHGQYFPPGISNVDELIDHLHRQASQMASLLDQHEPADAIRAAADDGRPAARRPPALGHGPPGRQPAGAAPGPGLRRAVPLLGRRADGPGGRPGRHRPAAAVRRAWSRSCSGRAIPTRWSASTPTCCAQLAGEEAQEDLEQLRELTRALEEAGLPGARRRAAGADPARRPQARHAGAGRHLQPAAPGVAGRPPAAAARAAAGSRPTRRRRFEHGDPFAVDLNRTLFNAMARGGPGTPVRHRARTTSRCIAPRRRRSARPCCCST